MTIAEQVYTIVQSLSEEQASEVLSFAATLQQRDSPPAIPEDEAQMRWQALVRSTAGAFPDFPSLEEIRSGYGEDVPRESF
jgi:hypothetical protein